MTRLVMFSGPTGGAGKTTLSRALTRELEERGDVVKYLADDAVFEEPSVSDIAERFRSKQFPDPELLVNGFERLLAAAGAVDWIIQETNWVLGGEDLPWAQASWEAIVNFARDTMAVAAPYDPIVFYLDLEVGESMRRMAERDGAERFEAWLGYMRRLAALAPWATEDPLALVTAWSERVRRIWDDADVQLVTIGATGSRDEVLARALAVLDV